MDHSFWHNKWAKKEIGFHLNEVNQHLVNYLNDLGLVKGSTIFLPLCGKTLDIFWLVEQGYKVVGCELSELAIQELFQEADTTPTVETTEHFKLYKSKHVTIYVGDILQLKHEQISIDAIYDRAALVALPLATRTKYVALLREVSNNAPQLIVTFRYNQELIPGPPFSITNDEIAMHFYGRAITVLEDEPLPGNLKGIPANEVVRLIK